MKLTVSFKDHRIQAIYANGDFKMVDFWTRHSTEGIVGEEELFLGNTTTKTAFTDAVTSATHNMDDYWAIQYYGGQMEIEYANTKGNEVISSNTGLQTYVSALNTWYNIIQDEKAESERLASIPSWDKIRKSRDTRLSESDKIIAWSTETGNTVPSTWITYRQELRDITTTYGAPTGNTELVVWPTEPSWPST